MNKAKIISLIGPKKKKTKKEKETIPSRMHKNNLSNLIKLPT